MPLLVAILALRRYALDSGGISDLGEAVMERVVTYYMLLSRSRMKKKTAIWIILEVVEYDTAANSPFHD